MVNCRWAVRCRMMEKTDRLGRAPEMVASARRMHTEKPASSTDTSLHASRHTHISAVFCMMTRTQQLVYASLICGRPIWMWFGLSCSLPSSTARNESVDPDLFAFQCCGHLLAWRSIFHVRKCVSLRFCV